MVWPLGPYGPLRAPRSLALGPIIKGGAATNACKDDTVASARHVPKHVGEQSADSVRRRGCLASCGQRAENVSDGGSVVFLIETNIFKSRRRRHTRSVKDCNCSIWIMSSFAKTDFLGNLLKVRVDPVRRVARMPGRRMAESIPAMA